MELEKRVVYLESELARLRLVVQALQREDLPVDDYTPPDKRREDLEWRMAEVNSHSKGRGDENY